MKTLYIQNTDLIRDKRFTYLASDAASGVTSLSVQSIIGFQSIDTSSGQIICIGEVGNEKSEIIKTSSTTSPSGTTVTLASGTLFDHPQDTKVFIVDWDRIDLQWSATVTGTKSTIRAYPMPIMADLPETLINDTSQTTGYYFSRFNETIGNTNSDWSDATPFGDYADNTVFKIKKRALDSINEAIDGSVITHEFLNQSLWEGRREYHNAPGKRPFRRRFEYPMTTVTTGMYRFLLPTDVQSPYTAENLFNVRIGVQRDMSYYDKKQWDQDFQGIAHSVLTVAYTVNDKDLYVTDTSDFAFITSGSASVIIEDDAISYSAVGVSTTAGTLRISSQGKKNHAAGRDVWQGVTSGLPLNFTVFSDAATVSETSVGSSYVYFSSPVSTVYVNQDIFIDYYRTVVDYDSDADVLDEPEYDMFVPYLAYRIKERKARGSFDYTKDPDYLLWTQKKSNALSREYLDSQIRIFPQISHLP